jgi:hypothetical protein
MPRAVRASDVQAAGRAGFSSKEIKKMIDTKSLAEAQQRCEEQRRIIAALPAFLQLLERRHGVINPKENTND